MYGLIILFSISTSMICLIFIPQVGYGKNFGYDEGCADKIFEKYMTDSKPVFDEYMDEAKDVLLPKSESEIDEYLGEIDILASDYLEDLEPYSERHLDELETCILKYHSQL